LLFLLLIVLYKYDSQGTVGISVSPQSILKVASTKMLMIGMPFIAEKNNVIIEDVNMGSIGIFPAESIRQQMHLRVTVEPVQAKEYFKAPHVRAQNICPRSTAF